MNEYYWSLEMTEIQCYSFHIHITKIQAKGVVLKSLDISFIVVLVPVIAFQQHRRLEVD